MCKEGGVGLFNKGFGSLFRCLRRGSRGGSVFNVSFEYLFLGPASRRIGFTRGRRSVFLRRLSTAVGETGRVVNSGRILRGYFHVCSGEERRIVVHLSGYVVCSGPRFSRGKRPRVVASAGFRIFDMSSGHNRRYVRGCYSI